MYSCIACTFSIRCAQKSAHPIATTTTLTSHAPHSHPVADFTLSPDNMTIPSRSAPPVPTTASNPSLSASSSSSSSSASRNSHVFWQQRSPSTETQQQHESFGQSQYSATANATGTRKVAPPRPPLPRLTPSPNQHQLKSQHRQPPSSNIASLTNIFRRMKTNDNRSKDLFTLPPPPAATHPTSIRNPSAAKAHNNYVHASLRGELSSPSTSAPAAVVPGELISFDSPPNSPTPTQASWASSMSFSSDLATTSSAAAAATHNESGFEDDFGSSLRLDPFSPELGGMPVFGSAFSTLVPSNSTQWSSDFLDPLCNGKSLLPPQVTNTGATVPTIIRPTIAKANVFGQDNCVNRNLSKHLNVGTISNVKNSAASTSLRNNSDADRTSVESYAVVLHQFDAIQEGDLNLMVSISRTNVFTDCSLTIL